MAIQLTPEQEQRIRAVVNAGAYRSAEEALDAAVSAVEVVAELGFEGSVEELEHLIVEGLDTRELPEGEFWDSIDRETGALLAANKPGSRA